MVNERKPNIAVIGLGYVGLPVAVALARHFDVTGFDINQGRVTELKARHDRTNEVSAVDLGASRLQVSSSAEDCRGADIYIVTVPTPVDSQNRPDLSALISATRMIADLIDRERCPTIVYESTVYPGVTEDTCGAELASHGLVRGRDFRLGYSPERINPGDREHGIERIVKVVAGEDDEVLEQLSSVYGAITSGGVFRAASIRAAEAAKAIENAQRDINIAFMNEIAQIAERIDLSLWDVLAAARTKWNFLSFEPGLVGGHCIGVDPYYLSHLAEQVGLTPQVVLAGRDTNDSMARWLADVLHERRGGPGSVLILGSTFKENVPDLRNSKVFDLAAHLRELGHQVRIADPVADPAELAGMGFRTGPPHPADLVVGAVRHRAYVEMGKADLSALVMQGGLLADIKGIWRHLVLRADIARWTL